MGFILLSLWEKESEIAAERLRFQKIVDLL
jgi:hypothetical protein